MMFILLATFLSLMGFVAAAPTNSTDVTNTCLTTIGYSFISQPNGQNLYYSSAYLGDDLICNDG
jgi:hypothetical protein